MESTAPALGGVGIRLAGESDFARTAEALAHWQASQGTQSWSEVGMVTGPSGPVLEARLQPGWIHQLCPGHDTLGLRQRLAAIEAPARLDGLMQETWVALLCAPRRLDFDSLEELQSHLRVRCNVARAAEKTALAFATQAAERPADFWHYDEDRGFLLQPGVGLIEALVAATQPESTGRLYDFSCYRASEYVCLLGMAQEAMASHPQLYERLQAASREVSFKGDRFYERFTLEYGTLDEPIPMRYYMPGDRVWFKNPDEYSSDATGYEGSWVVYMGGGFFSNFWKRDLPFTLESKALEMYVWRECTFRGEDQQLSIDEDRVEAGVRALEADPVRRQQVLERMFRYRDPRGVYAQGGCIDATRECPRPLGRVSLI